MAASAGLLFYKVNLGMRQVFNGERALANPHGTAMHAPVSSRRLFLAVSVWTSPEHGDEYT